MEIRQPIHSEHARTLDTAGLRRHFLVEDLFVPCLLYTSPSPRD